MNTVYCPLSTVHWLVAHSSKFHLAADIISYRRAEWGHQRLLSIPGSHQLKEELVSMCSVYTLLYSAVLGAWYNQRCGDLVSTTDDTRKALVSQGEGKMTKFAGTSRQDRRVG